MSRGGRIAILLGLLFCAVFMSVWTAMNYVGSEPATVSYLHSQPEGAPVHLVMQTDSAVGTGAHPTWVSYQIQTPKTRRWVHTALVELPVHARIDVTIYQFDSSTPLRNQFFGRVTGTIGGYARLDGKRFTVLDSYATPGVGHTFTVPSLNINVPLAGNTPTKKNFCTKGPCNPVTQEHKTMTFSFMTPDHPGNWRFQCFIPCGAGHYAGNAGPMQTLGYMDGFLEVRA